MITISVDKKDWAILNSALDAYLERLADNSNKFRELYEENGSPFLGMVDDEDQAAKSVYELKKRINDQINNGSASVST